MLCDTHAHLNDVRFEEDFDEVISRARVDSNIGFILNISLNRKTIVSSIDLAEKHDFIYAAIGWHPCDAENMTDKDLEDLLIFANHPKVVAIGEIGLDYYHNNTFIEKQKDIFCQQIDIAKQVDLPIIIHARDSYDDVMHILDQEHACDVGGVMHCFGGDLEVMKSALDMNFMIGLGGIVTFKNAVLCKEVAAMVPMDKLLLETDCPYLAPHPFRGKRNEPSYVRLVAESVAQLRGISVEEVISQTTANAMKLFKISGVCHG